MFDFEVFFKGTIIGQLQSDTYTKALNTAKKIYGNEVSVKQVI